MCGEGPLIKLENKYQEIGGRMEGEWRDRWRDGWMERIEALAQGDYLELFDSASQRFSMIDELEIGGPIQKF
ncbi:hypothetical protein BpHYR1_042997 [Brachionus plicatilis]|uniref:Uncharacterized protein n=1 Tax=Brachionus plicatilis TaxID=10195 RepID=A0A3M7SMR8_BRAPC|nr:hypothetical protein BpHYR1_042997 [Brachionus plicatilis]